MAYKRKTYDEWEIQGYYGALHGWEMLTTEETWKDAKAQLKCYRENEPGTAIRQADQPKRRIPITRED